MTLKLNTPPENPNPKDFVRWLTDQPSVIRKLRDLTTESWKRAIPEGTEPNFYGPAEDAAAKRARQYLCSMAEKYVAGEPPELAPWAKGGRPEVADEQVNAP